MTRYTLVKICLIWHVLSSKLHTLPIGTDIVICFMVRYRDFVSIQKGTLSFHNNMYQGTQSDKSDILSTTSLISSQTLLWKNALELTHSERITMREIVHLQAGQCGNQIGAKVKLWFYISFVIRENHLGRKFCDLISVLIQLYFTMNILTYNGACYILYRRS